MFLLFGFLFVHSNGSHFLVLFQFNFYSIEEEWEKELQAELQDYELESEGSGQTGIADADDIEEMLNAEDMSLHVADLK